MRQQWVALIGPEFEENLSLRYLASALARVGFRSEILPFNQGSQLPGLVERITRAPEPPVLVGISMAFQWRAPDMLALAVALREGGYSGHITFGGHFATFASKEVLRDFPEVDSICRQEAEETLVELVQRVASGQAFGDMLGLAVRDAQGVPGINPLRNAPELATLAWPDRRGEPAECFGHRIAPLVSTRGCYANCTFCCIAAWHEQVLPGKRYRERPLEDVADEMASLHHERGIDIFVFHDDNFFLPSGAKNAERLNRLADLLEARKVRHFATVVKARPTDVQERVFPVLVERLHCIRCYVGIETDADQGLKTLQRWAKPKHNWEAMERVERLGLYTCFNVLLFDPDTTIESLEDNLEFMEAHAHHPFNFGRTELYAGTPLLHRMQKEGRARGDWLQWDYSLHDAQVERVFALTSTVFHERNFAPDALANTLMSTRFDVEVVRRFHPEQLLPGWLDEGKALCSALGTGSVRAMREIIARVREEAPPSGDPNFSRELAERLRAEEAGLRVRARALAARLAQAVPQGLPLTEIGDRVATPLQRARAEVSL
ncbi:B12-binding domain-containing radical SAM protein [Hyalangium versicolor]|uniref:B12-binding domain-containing radical SAM protein n=1 Tax=Hyalangium versicolor TaxID=2861190 RepID=UPI001CCBAAEA|nr:cobalamin-dependent protein [Hyalangium versicolor]